MTSTEKLLCDLIALPSVNPAFLPEGAARAGEGRVVDFLTASAAAAGLDVELAEVFPGRSNLLARLTPSGKVRRRLLLAPHLDTVNGSDEQFTPRKKGGRIYGRGACDTKGSVAAMFSALCELAKSGAGPSSTEIVFVGLMDEENLQTGSRALARSGLKADLAIVGEATELKVVTAHKGSLWLTIETEGVSAHGARPELGKNAVLAMARVVEALETTYADQLRRRRHPLLGHGTVSVGTIRGGTQANIVPAHCSILIDRRTLPGETEQSVAREIKALMRPQKIEVKISNNKEAPCLPLETRANLPLVRQFMSAAGQTQPVGVHYFCDASVLARAGIPSVVFGPGDIAQAHTADEWLEVASLEKATAILRQFLSGLP